MESGGRCSSPCGGLPTIHHFEAILKEIGELARRQAEEFLRVAGREGLASGDSQDAPCGQSHSMLLDEQLVETYRLLIIPDKTLLGYFECLGAEEVRREFRRLAVLVHPDKNKHPSAKAAFQKLYNNFLAALPKNN